MTTTFQGQAIFDTSQAVQSLNTLAQAANGAEGKTKKLGDTTSVTKTKTQDLGKEINDTAGKIGNAARAVQGLAQQFGLPGSSAGLIASLAGNVQQFSQLGAMLGPTGAVIGGISGLALGLATLIEREETAAERMAAFTEEVESNTTALRANAIAANEAATAAELRNRTVTTESALLGTSTEEIENRILEAEARREAAISGLTDATERLRAAREAAARASARTGIPSGGGDVAAIEAEIESLTTERNNAVAESDRLSEELDRREREGLAGRTGALEAGRERTAEAATAAENALEDSRAAEDERKRAENEAAAERARARAEELQNTFDEWDAARDAAYAEADEKRKEEIRNAFDELKEAADEEIRIEEEKTSAIKALDQEIIESERAKADARKALNDTANEATETFRNSVRGSVADVISSWEAAREAQAAAHQELTTVSQGMEASMTAVGNTALTMIGEGLAQAFAQGIVAAIQGGESFDKVMLKMTQSLLSNLLQESIVQGLKELALGIADTASYRYDSAALHYAAFGAWTAVAVAAGGALAGVTAAAGGGAGATSGATTATAARRDQEQQTQEPTTVNVYYQNPSFQTTQEQAEALNQVLRRGGYNITERGRA